MGKGKDPTLPPCLCTNPVPVKQPITIQDGVIENLIYLVSRSKIMPALQAMAAVIELCS